MYCFGNPVRYWDPSGNASTDNFDNANDMLSQGFDDPKSGGGGNNTNTQQSGQWQSVSNGQIHKSGNSLNVKTNGNITAPQKSSQTSKVSSGKGVYVVKTKTAHMSKAQANSIKSAVSEGKSIRFPSKNDAVEFINRNYKNLKQEIEYGRSAQGWHFGEPHPGFNMPHIDVYSKHPKFSAHFFWE